MPGDPTQAEVETGERLLAAALAAGRIAIGVGLWLAPQRSARALGFADLDDRSLALARIAATRDVVLGVAQAASLGDRSRLTWASAAAAAADAGDTLTFALALAGGEATRAAGLRGLPAAAGAALAGGWLAVRLGQRR